MDNFVTNILETVTGGLVLTLLLFVLKEYIFIKKNLTGEWKAILKIDSTSYRPFENLSLEFRFHILQKGNELVGSGEKISESTFQGEKTTYKRDKRVKVEIIGYYQKRYIRRSKINLNIIEAGRQRESRSTYFLTLKNSNLLKGNFSSTAADTLGSVKMNKL